jgi:hypothetical protein
MREVGVELHTIRRPFVAARSRPVAPPRPFWHPFRAHDIPDPFDGCQEDGGRAIGLASSTMISDSGSAADRAHTSDRPASL